MNNITSANATAVMTAATIFSGVYLEQFATDQSVMLDEVVLSESRMGVDGNMVSGYTPTIKAVTLNLQPSSPSIASLDSLVAAMEVNKTVYEITLIFTIPSLGKVYTFTGGVLTSGKIMADAAKTMQDVTYKLQFAKVDITKI